MKFKIFARVIITILAIVLLSLNVFASSQNINDLYNQATSSLVGLDIIKKSDNTEGNITKADFVKMIVLAMGKEDEISSLNGSTIFNDINVNSPYSGYINIGVKYKIVSGYADGTFRPNEEINYAQAVTIILRALGYSSTDVNGIWPQNYIEKAKKLEITNNLTVVSNNKVSKRDAMLMIYRALSTKINDQDKSLAEYSGLGTSKTCIILDSYDLDKTLPKNTVKTDIGDFKASEFNGFSYIGKKLMILTDSDNNLIAVQKVVENSDQFFVNAVVGNKVEYYGKTGKNSVEIPENMDFYYNGTKQTFKDVRQKILPGSVISLLINNGNSQYNMGVLIDPSTSEPYVVQKDVSINDMNIGLINISNPSIYTVYKNNELSSYSNIKMYDVVYEVKNPYASLGGFLLVYDKKYTGIYEEALPNKNSVSSIILSGKQYEIETSAATSKLNNSYGAFDIDSEITILTGINGKIVDVISPGSSTLSNIAIVLNTRTGAMSYTNSIDHKIYYVKLYKVDGTEIECQTLTDQSFRKGSVVEYEIKDGIATINPVSRNTVSGVVNKFDKMIGDTWVAQNVKLLDVYKDDKSEDDVAISEIEWADLPSEFSSSKVLHAQIGGPFDDVQLIVFNNLMEASDFGILLEENYDSRKKTKTVNGAPVDYYVYNVSYKVMMNGSVKSYNYTFDGEDLFGVNIGDVVCVRATSSGLKDMYSLSPRAKATEIQAIDMRRIKLNDIVYRVSQNVQVYDISSATPTKISYTDLVAGKVKYIGIYSNGGDNNQIKFITVIKEQGESD